MPLEVSKSAGVSVSTFDGTLARSICPGSGTAATTGSGAGAGATGRGPTAGAALRRGGLRVSGLRRTCGAVRAVESGVVPMTLTSGRVRSAVCARADPGSVRAPNASACNIRPVPDHSSDGFRPRFTNAPHTHIDRSRRFPPSHSGGSNVTGRGIFIQFARERLAMCPRGHTGRGGSAAQRSRACATR